MPEEINGYCSRCGEPIVVNSETQRGWCANCQDDKQPLQLEDLSEFMSQLYGFYWVDDENKNEE